MSKRDVTIRWVDPNLIEKGHKVYRSADPMDITNMPLPIASIGKNTTEYIDTNLTVGDTVYYRVSAWINNYETFSDEMMLVIPPNISVYGAYDSGVFVKIDYHGQEEWRNESITGSNIIYVDYDSNVYTGSADGTVRKFGEDGVEQWSFTGHTSTVNALYVDIEGYVYSASSDNTVRKIDATGTQVWSFTGHTNNVNAVYVDIDGYVYSASSDNTVRKISNDGDQVWSFAGHTGVVNAVYIDADSNVYSASNDNTIRRISEEGNQVWSYTGHSDDVNTIFVDEDGFIYSGSRDMSVRKLAPDSSEVWLSGSHEGSITGLRVDMDGLVYVATENLIKKLDRNGIDIWAYDAVAGLATSVAVTHFPIVVPVTIQTITYSKLYTPLTNRGSGNATQNVYSKHWSLMTPIIIE